MGSVLLPTDPASGLPITPLQASRQKASEQQAAFETECSVQTNKVLLELCGPALRLKGLALCETENADNCLLRTLLFHFVGPNCDSGFVDQACARLHAEVSRMSNCAEIIQFFCRTFDCQVKLFEFIGDKLSEFLFQSDCHLTEPFTLCILQGYENQFFALKDWVLALARESTKQRRNLFRNLSNI